ncbi:MAG: ATP-binding cassette domain-containing protein [Planctomycetota bacterium]
MARLEIDRLRVDYGGERPAVDEVTFTIPSGEARALVGASGAGKSTIGMAALGLVDRSAVVEGHVRVDSTDMLTRGPAARAKRGRVISHMGQTPEAMFNPSRRVGVQITEVVRLDRRLSKRANRDLLASRLDEVGLTPDHGQAWPHQLSGGQLRRAALAMALAVDPMLLVADEPTASLDPLHAREVVMLLARLRAQRKLGLLLITHDLAVAAALCSSAIVLKEGRLVEAGPWAQLEQPYSLALVAAAREAETGSI